jgi:hypothetical protein
MFKKLKMADINDYFKPLSEREEEGVYFARIINYGSKTKKFIKKYLQELENNGVYLNVGLQNPMQDRIEFLRKILKNQFKHNIDFFIAINSTLFPQLDISNSRIISEAIYEILDDMKNAAKNKMKIERFYIKIMCWFYYDFQEIVKSINSCKIRKILYNGNISKNKMDMMRIFSKIGCDIVILLVNGDSEYLKIDPKSEISDVIFCDIPEKFPKRFYPEKTKNELKYQEELDQILKNIQISHIFSTNEWIKTDIFSAALKKHDERGNDDNTFYNMFVQIKGVEDANTYNKKLTEWKIELDAASKKVVIINKMIQEPSLDEKEKIEVAFCKNNYELITQLYHTISFEKLPIIEKMIKKAFIELMTERILSNIEMLKSSLIQILCWIKRFIPFLFVDRNLKNYPIFIYYNANISSDETIFLRLLSRLPVDVFILLPNLSISSTLKDNLLLKIKYINSISADRYPRYEDEVKFVAKDHNPENNLAGTIYKDTNMYENYQYIKHRFRNVTFIVQKKFSQEHYSFWRELYSLWNKKPQSRPNFESVDNNITIPTICVELIGTFGIDAIDYWEKIKRLLTNNCIILTGFPYIKKKKLSSDNNLLSSFIVNSEVQIEKILCHPSYKYKYLRKEMQEYMLNILQELLDSQIIKNTFKNGTEYKIIDIVLNLDTKFLKLINGYYFTGKIPKLICIDISKRMWSLEDSILIAYVRQLGFDIASFSPAGYKNIGAYLKDEFFVEYKLGHYMDDLIVPNFEKIELPEEKESIIKIFLRSIGILKKYV